MAVNINIDNISTDLNNKADKDLTNSVGALSSSAKEYFTKISLPSDKYVNLTLGASGAMYTAPADGYVYLRMKLNSGERFFINTIFNSVETYGVLLGQIASVPALAQILPIKKGATFNVGYGTYSDTPVFRFIYAQGSESEV